MPRSIQGTICVAFDDSSSLGPSVAQVRVSTAAGQVDDPVAATSAPQPLRVPDGASGWLRITVTGLSSQPSPAIGTQVSIYDISIPGVRAGRTIVAPSVPGGDPSAVVLAKDEPQPSGCMLTSLRWVCSPELTQPTEEQFGFDHSFTEPAPEQATLRGSAILIDSALADRFVRLSPRQARVTASSTYTGDPQDQALSAFDGNPATAWVASATDMHPTLSIQWGYQRTVSKLTIQRPPGASGLLQVLITGSNGQVRGALLDASGVTSFAPMRTTGLKFIFSQVQAPLQITDVIIPGVPFVAPPSGTFRLKCGLGPLIELNGKVVQTRVSGSFASLLTGRPLRFTACSPVTLARGDNRVVEPATDAFSVQDVVGERGAAYAYLCLPAEGRWRRVVDVDVPGAAGQRRDGLLPGREREFQRGVAGGHRRQAATGGAARRVEAGLAASGWYQRPSAPDVPACPVVPGRRRRRAGCHCPGPAGRRVALARSAAPAQSAHAPAAGRPSPARAAIRQHGLARIGAGWTGGHRPLAGRISRRGHRARGHVLVPRLER